MKRTPLPPLSRLHELTFLSVDIGILVDPKLDLTAMLGAKDKAVTTLTSGIEYLFKKNGAKTFSCADPPPPPPLVMQSPRGLHHAADHPT